MVYISLANPFLCCLVCVFKFPQRPFGYSNFSPKTGKIQAIFVVQSLKISIWSCALIYFFRLDSHSVLTRYPEQSFKFIKQLSPLSGSLNSLLWVLNCHCFFCNICFVFKDYLLDILEVVCWWWIITAAVVQSPCCPP